MNGWWEACQHPGPRVDVDSNRRQCPFCLPANETCPFTGSPSEQRRPHKAAQSVFVLPRVHANHLCVPFQRQKSEISISVYDSWLAFVFTSCLCCPGSGVEIIGPGGPWCLCALFVLSDTRFAFDVPLALGADRNNWIIFIRKWLFRTHLSKVHSDGRNCSIGCI